MIAGLTDRVDVVAATETVDGYGNVVRTWDPPVVVAVNVPAIVTYVTSAIVSTGGRQAIVEQLRAVIEPREFDPVTNRLVWRGQHYDTDGAPMIRRENGQDHHLTIPLKLVSG